MLNAALIEPIVRDGLAVVGVADEELEARPAAR